ncbi:MAG: NPP1 family protein [Candidatus Helarchaeota archaeon]|nr:NPP1 family protein [Candidatus Helarchaeota archaeon]
MKKDQINMDGKKVLAKRFCPILRFHKKEPFTPTHFVELFRTAKGDVDFTGSKPERRWKKKARFDKETGLNWFAPAAYVHFLEDMEIEIGYKKRRVPLIIQYFYYFAYNEYFWGEIIVPFLNHRHDWEIIQVALDKVSGKDKYEILSYSISAHGTFLEINDQRKVQFHKTNGFHCHRGAHNFGSIFYLPNQPKKNDLIIKPETLIPTSDGKRIPLKDALIFLDEEYNLEYLKKFSFNPLIPPWKREFYYSATWIPEFWSWSFNRQLKYLIKVFGKSM